MGGNKTAWLFLADILFLIEWVGDQEVMINSIYNLIYIKQNNNKKPHSMSSHLYLVSLQCKKKRMAT